MFDPSMVNITLAKSIVVLLFTNNFMLNASGTFNQSNNIPPQDFTCLRNEVAPYLTSHDNNEII